MNFLKKLWRKRKGYIAWSRKALINVTGLVSSLLTLQLLSDPWAGWVATGCAVATAVTHWLVPNAPTPDVDVTGDPVPAT